MSRSLLRNCSLLAGQGVGEEEKLVPWPG
ncbi:hypothetical protein AVEN_3310-1, partial [Araneus ventricosus]